MPRSAGFARGDIDTAFPLDDKFLALRGKVPTPVYYAAVGVYFHVVAASWREAERKTAIRVVPDAGDLIEELIAVGLLDDGGRVPPRAFTAWVGRARKARKAAADRQARKRTENANTKSEVGDTPSSSSLSKPVRLSQEVTPLSRVTARDSAGTVGTEGTVRKERQGDPDPEMLAAYRRLGLPVDVA